MRQEMVGFWDAVASAANNLHLAPGRQPHQHLISQFFAGRMLCLMPNQQCQSTEGRCNSLQIVNSQTERVNKQGRINAWAN